MDGVPKQRETGYFGGYFADVNQNLFNQSLQKSRSAFNLTVRAGAVTQEGVETPSRAVEGDFNGGKGGNLEKPMPVSVSVVRLPQKSRA